MAQRVEVEKLTLDATDAVPIAQTVAAGVNTGSFAFSAAADRVLLYREGEATQNSQLRWFDRSGKAIGDVGEPARQGNPALSPDGTRLAVERGRDIWVIELARGLARRLTFDSIAEMAPIWSRDGASIAYYSEAEGPAGDVYRIPAGGGRATPVVQAPTPVFPYTWSPDGAHLLYGIVMNGAPAIWSQPLAGARKPLPYLEGTYFQTTAEFSPDGKWVAYVSRETGRSEVFIDSFPTPGSKTQVSVAGGQSPRWRGDGRELYYVSLDQRLTAVDLTPGATVQIGNATPLFQMALPSGQLAFVSADYDVTADGKRFIVNVPERADGTPITVVMNWPAAIKKP